ncbi:hypothetical protein AHAS_Ahas05G0286200 [Arachis hypogaea]
MNFSLKLSTVATSPTSPFCRRHSLSHWTSSLPLRFFTPLLGRQPAPIVAAGILPTTAGSSKRTLIDT